MTQPTPDRGAVPNPWTAVATIGVAPLDVALAVVTAAMAAILGGLLSLGLGGLLAAGLLGGLVLVRRAWPVPALLGAALVMSAAHLALPWPPAAAVVPITVFYVTVVLTGQLGWALAIGGVHLLMLLVGAGAAEDLILVVLEALWLVAAIGVAYWLRRRGAGDLAAAAAAADPVRDEAWRRAQEAEERVRIAHELHDVVAHTLAVVGVHLNVAADTLDSDPAEARAALRLAQEVRGRAMADLKSLIALLRDGNGRGIPAPHTGLAGLAGLTDRIRAAGLAVTLTEIGDPTVVPAPVGLAAFRVIQEALTNTVQHAEASRAIVTLRYTDEDVWVAVADDGRGVPDGAAPVPTGHGLAGMRERVTALGGRFTAGPGEDGGFVVHATIPVG